jgi:beta-1,3-galactosyltransferase 1
MTILSRRKLPKERILLFIVAYEVLVYFSLQQMAVSSEKKSAELHLRYLNKVGARTWSRIPSDSLNQTASLSLVAKYFEAVNFNVKKEYFSLAGIVHPHDYVFTLQPEIKACTAAANSSNERKILVLSFVVVGVEFFERRTLIRNTWANRSLYDEYDMQVFFMVGFSRDDKINQMVREEARIYKDILQENYIDSYRFMTAKIIGALKWASTHCLNTHFLLRINDDVVVHTRRMLGFLKSKMRQAARDDGHAFGNALMGKFIKNDRADREKSHKFYMSPDDYNETCVMPYMNGEFYLITSDLAAKYVNLSLYVHWPPFSVWWEDLYMAMLSLHLGVDFVLFNKHYFDHDQNKKSDTIAELKSKSLDSVFFL